MKSKKMIALALAAALSVGTFVTPYTTYATEEPVPGKTETPETPETPTTPETPENPETPTTPENPENPENPETPETPETPEKTPEEIAKEKALEDAVAKAKEAVAKAEPLKDKDSKVASALDALNTELAKEDKTVQALQMKTQAVLDAVDAYEKAASEKEPNNQEDTLKEKAKLYLEIAKEFPNNKEIQKRAKVLKDLLVSKDAKKMDIEAAMRSLDYAFYMEAIKDQPDTKVNKDRKKIITLLEQADQRLMTIADKNVNKLNKTEKALFDAFKAAQNLTYKTEYDEKEFATIIANLEKAIADFDAQKAPKKDKKDKKVTKKKVKKLPQTGAAEMSSMAMAASALVAAGVIVSKKRK